MKPVPIAELDSFKYWKKHDAEQIAKVTEKQVLALLYCNPIKYRTLKSLGHYLMPTDPSKLESVARDDAWGYSMLPLLRKLRDDGLAVYNENDGSWNKKGPCDHRAHIRIDEETVGRWEHWVKDGIVYHYPGEPDPTGAIVAKCLDCGIKARYTRSSAPGWLRQKLRELLDYVDGERIR